MFNVIIKLNSVPKLWRKYHTVAVLVFERLMLKRVQGTIEGNLIPEQAGFRKRKSSESQLLNLTQHIEDGYQRKQITGAVFVDLSAAYDTVNHNRFLNSQK